MDAGLLRSLDETVATGSVASEGLAETCTNEASKQISSRIPNGRTEAPERVWCDCLPLPLVLIYEMVERERNEIEIGKYYNNNSWEINFEPYVYKLNKTDSTVSGDGLMKPTTYN